MSKWIGPRAAELRVYLDTTLASEFAGDPGFALARQLAADALAFAEIVAGKLDEGHPNAGVRKQWADLFEAAIFNAGQAVRGLQMSLDASPVGFDRLTRVLTNARTEEPLGASDAARLEGRCREQPAPLQQPPLPG